MKKLLVILLIAQWAPAFAGDNPFFGDTKNQVALHVGHSVGAGSLNHIYKWGDWRSESFEQIMISYSQPSDFFRLPARQTIHVGMNVGYNSMKDFTNPVAGISQDVAFLTLGKFYFGAGAGGFIKLDYNDRQDSLFTFGAKLFTGYRIGGAWSIELYYQHQSNGGMTPVNGGYNFIGMGILWNF